MLLVAVPLNGEICSQFPPVTGETEALNPALPPEAVSKMVCEGAAVEAPCICVNVSLDGDTTTVVFEETVNTTGMVSAPLGRLELVLALIVIDPE
jgi:hypothetical protein